MAVEAGAVIRAIDGVELTADRNAWSLLAGKAGDRVRLTVESPDGARTDHVVKPISSGAESQLRYERWVRQRRDLVEELSGGRLGYVHVRGMNDQSYRVVKSEVLGRHYQKEGLVVDTRFNGGGWLHDDLAVFLGGRNYVRFAPRNQALENQTFRGEPGSRWARPSIVLMSESNYSDGHFFPWAYRELGLGELVGMPVPGTATAVWWETLHTGDIVFGIPQVGMVPLDGGYLENRELMPDLQVELDPESAAKGDDTQLKAAVKRLLESL